jgi:hypothetical protein
MDMSLIIHCDENLENDEIRFEYDWIKIGYTEEGELIQIHRTTKEMRILGKWTEIFKDK